VTSRAYQSETWFTPRRLAGPRYGLLSLLTVVLVACGGRPEARQAGQPGSGPGTSASIPKYEARIGIAVPTASRTCLAIQNADLSLKTPITLVVPSLPQSVIPAEISNVSGSTCPITQDVQAGITSYDLHVIGKAPAKLMPLIAVVGDAARFTMNNIQVQADLNGDRSTQTFRACRGENGVHLTVWNGIPLTGAPLWHGFYYEPSQATPAPVCSAGEQTRPTN
jgi:hypothetical protein